VRRLLFGAVTCWAVYTILRKQFDDLAEELSAAMP
jgi:hypothetical protein